LRQIGALPDHQDRRIAIKELDENFAAETHFGDDYDAQRLCFHQAQLARREVRARGKSFASIQASLEHVRLLLFGPWKTRRRSSLPAGALVFESIAPSVSQPCEGCLVFFGDAVAGGALGGPRAEMRNRSAGRLTYCRGQAPRPLQGVFSEMRAR